MEKVQIETIKRYSIKNETANKVQIQDMKKYSTEPITGVFNYVTPPEGSLLTNTGSVKGYVKSFPPKQKLESVDIFQVGRGNTAVKIDKQGMSMGGNKFKQAPIRQTVDGSIFINNNGKDMMVVGVLQNVNLK